MDLFGEETEEEKKAAEARAAAVKASGKKKECEYLIYFLTCFVTTLTSWMEDLGLVSSHASEQVS